MDRSTYYTHQRIYAFTHHAKMLDAKFIRENLELVKESLEKRGDTTGLDRFLEADKKRRDLLKEADVLKQERNKVSKEVGRLKAEGKDITEKSAGMKEVSQKIKDLDQKIRETDEELNNILLLIPNPTDESVPMGKSEEDNKEVRTWGDKPKFSFTPRSHVELGEKLDILDFERGAKLSGARFVIYKGLGAKLERALINFMLDLHTKRSEEHTSELQSHSFISYAVFCLKKKKNQ